MKSQAEKSTLTCNFCRTEAEFECCEECCNAILAPIQPILDVLVDYPEIVEELDNDVL